MTVVEVNDLAFQYAESKKDQFLSADRYRDAATWFKGKGGTQEEYSVFIDLVHLWTQNYTSLLLSDAYTHAEEF